MLSVLPSGCRVSGVYGRQPCQLSCSSCGFARPGSVRCLLCRGGPSRRTLACLSFLAPFSPYASRVWHPAGAFFRCLVFCCVLFLTRVFPLRVLSCRQPALRPPCYLTKLLHLLHQITSPNYFTYFTNVLLLLHQITSLTSPDYFTYFNKLLH